MRHVTDGELHAFLDGGLDLLAGGRGEEVRAHVGRCPACQERLQDEELVRAQAEEILGDPSLGDIRLPTFEDLRERAAAPGPSAEAGGGRADTRVHYRGPLQGLPLAWAATIVLALGVGWMGGRVWRAGPSEDSRAGAIMPEVEFQESPDVRFSDIEARAPAGESSDPTDATRASSRGGGSPMEGEESAALTPAVGVTLRGSSDNPLAVPGLKVASIEWEEWGPGEKALLIRQLLSPEDTLELRYLGLLLGTDPEPRPLEETGPVEGGTRGRRYANVLEASLRPGWNQVVMNRERGLLVARAPIPEADLKALLKSLH